MPGADDHEIVLASQHLANGFDPALRKNHQTICGNTFLTGRLHQCSQDDLWLVHECGLQSVILLDQALCLSRHIQRIQK